MRALRIMNGAFWGFCLAGLLIAANLSDSQKQEPTGAVLIPLLGGLVLGLPIGGIVVGRLPAWPAEFPGKEVRAWGWCALGALMGIAAGFGLRPHPGGMIFLAASGGLIGLEIAALLGRAVPLARTLVLMVVLSAALWLGSWAWERHQQREHWRRTRPASPVYRVTPRPTSTPGPTLADDLKTLRRLSPQTEAVERLIQASRHSVEAQQGIVVFLKEVPTPTKETADARFPLSQILLGLHRYPFPEAVPALIELEKRCAHKGNVLGDRVILAIIDCDTPAGRKYVREQLAVKERTVSVSMAMLRAQNPWGHAEAEVALRKRGELTVLPDRREIFFRGKR
ncbi:MAG: hypothetical protein QM758_15015 [Armatimonas sp.]